MMRVAGLIVAALLLAPILPFAPRGSLAAVAYAHDYDDDDNEDDGSRGNTEMLREQQKESDRDEFSGVGDTNERAQEREEKILDTQHQRDDLQEDGGGGIKEFFGDKDDNDDD